MRDYTKIAAWKLADDLTVAIYESTRSFPRRREELYGLTSQFRRAASSVPANIVEGSARESKKNYLHFLYIARGSLAETQYFVHLAQRLGYLSETNVASLIAQSRRTFACLHGLTMAAGKEVGNPAKIATTITSPIVLGFVHLSGLLVFSSLGPMVPWPSL